MLPGQGWDPASPPLLTVLPFTEGLLLLVLPSHKLCSAASLLSGDRRTLQEQLIRMMNTQQKNPNSSILRADLQCCCS